jgi:hypothetical protein
MKNLKNQVAQQAIVASHQQGQLPPKPEQNPKKQAKVTIFYVDASTITKVDAMIIFYDINISAQVWTFFSGLDSKY